MQYTFATQESTHARRTCRYYRQEAKDEEALSAGSDPSRDCIRHRGDCSLFVPGEVGMGLDNPGSVPRRGRAGPGREVHILVHRVQGRRVHRRAGRLLPGDREPAEGRSLRLGRCRLLDMRGALLGCFGILTVDWPILEV